MARYIDADRLNEAILADFQSLQTIDESTAFIFRNDIDECPTADVKPVVRGEWLDFTGDFSSAECDKCGAFYEVSPDEMPCEDFFSAFKQFYKFCPNCGADMREDE